MRRLAFVILAAALAACSGAPGDVASAPGDTGTTDRPDTRAATSAPPPDAAPDTFTAPDTATEPDAGQDSAPDVATDTEPETSADAASDAAEAPPVDVGSLAERRCRAGDPRLQWRSDGCHDTTPPAPDTREIRCDFAASSDGSIRCLPAMVGAPVYFYDSTCLASHGQWLDVTSIPATWYRAEQHAASIPIAGSLFEVHAVTVATRPPPGFIYYGPHSMCREEFGPFYYGDTTRNLAIIESDVTEPPSGYVAASF